MTPDERQNPHMIDISRRRRIAAGGGVDPSDVSSLVKQFDAMAALVKQMSQMSMLDKIRAMTGLGRAGAFNPGAKLVAPKQGTGKRLSPKEREKLRKEREKEERKRRREQRDQRARRRRAVARAAALVRKPPRKQFCRSKGDESNRTGVEFRWAGFASPSTRS